MKREDIWKLANRAGVEKDSFGKVLCQSNLIIRTDFEVYALIGSGVSVTARA